MEYTLKTEIMDNHKIVQTLIRDQVETLSRWVCDTKDQGTRYTLIVLGWIPPSQLTQKNNFK
jgi:hypothetical protein